MRYKLLFILVLNINFNIFSQKNILFIAVDDLKPMFNSYGYNNIITPNIDALAAKGTLFSNASNQQSKNNFGLSPQSLQIQYPLCSKVFHLLKKQAEAYLKFGSNS